MRLLPNQRLSDEFGTTTLKRQSLNDDLFGSMRRSAEFSPCRTWRYSLIRVWDDALPMAVFVLLNPSTADEFQDDPTNRRGIGFASAWGYGGVTFVNLFAVRSKHPKTIKEVVDPVGPENDDYIRKWVGRAGIVVCGWGNHGSHNSRDKSVKELLRDCSPHYLKLTKEGNPWHPLYLKSTLQPTLWTI